MTRLMYATAVLLILLVNVCAASGVASKCKVDPSNCHRHGHHSSEHTAKTTAHKHLLAKHVGGNANHRKGPFYAELQSEKVPESDATTQLDEKTSKDNSTRNVEKDDHETDKSAGGKPDNTVTVKHQKAQSSIKSENNEPSLKSRNMLDIAGLRSEITPEKLIKLKKSAFNEVVKAREAVNNMQKEFVKITEAKIKIEKMLSGMGELQKKATKEKKTEIETLMINGEAALIKIKNESKTVEAILKEANEELDVAEGGLQIGHDKTKTDSHAEDACETAIEVAQKVQKLAATAEKSFQEISKADNAAKESFEETVKITPSKAKPMPAETPATYDKSITANPAPFQYKYDSSGCPIEKSSVLSPHEIQPMRLVAYTNSLDRYSKYCEEATGSKNSIRPDFWNNKIQCSPGNGTVESSDVLTEEKRKKIKDEILPALIKAFENGPLRYRTEGPLRVPYLRFGNRCQHFMFPEAHNKIGVNDSDVMMYVGAMPMRPTDDSSAVRAEPCTSIDGRVVAVALNFNPRHILDGQSTIDAAVKTVSKAIGASPCPCDTAVILTLKHYKYSWKRLNYCAASYFDGSNDSMEVYFRTERQWFNCSKNSRESSGIWTGPFVCQLSGGPNANKNRGGSATHYVDGHPIPMIDGHEVPAIDGKTVENAILRSLSGDGVSMNFIGLSSILLVSLSFLTMLTA